MKPKVFLLVALMSVLSISTTAFAQQEEITLSTYYPAPFGEYDELCAEKLLVDLPSAAELQDMERGDCHITRSLIVGSGAGTGFSYDELNAAANLPANGDVLIRGDVGIGTTGPEAPLDVRAALSANEPIIKLSKSGATAFGDGFGIHFKIANELAQFGTYDTTKIIDVLEGGGNRHGLAFWTRTSGASWGERMRIDADGNLGIGTTEPASLLHVAQNDGAGDSVRAPIVVSRYWASANDTRAGAMYSYYNSATANDQLAFGVTGGGGAITSPALYSNAKMVVQANGNVGIGTTTPAAKLDVSSTTSGFLPPRMTAAQRDAIPAGNRVPGTIIYNSVADAMEYWDGSNWVRPGKEICIVKPVSEGRTGEVLQDDSHLKFTIGPNELWQFEIVAICYVDASGDIKASVRGPMGIQMLTAFADAFFAKAGGERTDTYKATYIDTYNDNLYFNLDSDFYTKVTIKGTVKNGANTGTFAFQWCKRAAATPATMVIYGSYLIARRIE